jgi:hypothetical protein
MFFSMQDSVEDQRHHHLPPYLFRRSGLQATGLTHGLNKAVSPKPYRHQLDVLSYNNTLQRKRSLIEGIRLQTSFIAPTQNPGCLCSCAGNMRSPGGSTMVKALLNRSKTEDFAMLFNT